MVSSDRPNTAVALTLPARGRLSLSPERERERVFA